MKQNRLTVLLIHAISIATLLAGCYQAELKTETTSVVTSGAQRVRPSSYEQSVLFVSNGDAIDVLTYPQAKFIGRYSNVTPSGECTDSSGDIAVTDSENARVIIYEGDDLNYPVTLPDPGYYADGCSIDSTTGSLAVTNGASLNSKMGSVAIFASFYGEPKLYTIPHFYFYGYCGYDASGNLFVDGTDDASPIPNVEFAELPKGSSKFIALKLATNVTSDGAVQWDGHYVTLEDPHSAVVYRLQIEGSKAEVKGAVKLLGPVLHGQSYIVPPIGKSGAVFLSSSYASGTYEDVSFWKYPAGGKPFKTVSRFFRAPLGMTVRIAQY